MKRQLLIATLLTGLLLTGCSEEGILFSKEFKGEGDITVVSFDDIFNGVDPKNLEVYLDGLTLKNSSVKLNINDYGDSHIEIRSNQNIIDSLEISFKDGKLHINGEEEKKYVSEELQITIFGVGLNSLNIGNCALTIANSMYGYNEEFLLSSKGVIAGTLNLAETKKVKLNLDGTANLNLESVNLDKLDVAVSGVAYLSGTGKVDTYNDTNDGVITTNFLDMEIRKAEVSCSGTSSYEMTVTDILDVKSNGTIDIRYKGNPSMSTVVAGVTNIEQIEETTSK